MDEARLSYPVPENEIERLAALKRFELLDSDPEEIFDAVTRTLSTHVNVPIALITLLDESRQWFLSKCGLDTSQTPREYAFCTYAILHDEPLIITDALKDERFKDNPLVLGPPNVRFYAGAPLRMKDGLSLGTLCAIDSTPRQISETELSVLKNLAKVVVETIELRHAARHAVSQERSAAAVAEKVSWERTQALRASEERFQDISSNVPGVVYQFKIDALGRRSFPYVSNTVRAIFGVEPEAVMSDPEQWFTVVHPDDRQSLETSILLSYEAFKPWSWEGRVILSSGELAWFRGSATPRALPDGAVLWTGLIFDISEIKAAEVRVARAQKMESMGQLTGGVAHDFNNLLGVILGNAELLKGGVGNAGQSVDSIIRAATRGAELTQRLLAFSRQQPLRPQAIDIGALVLDMSGMLTRAIGETIEVEIIAARDLWRAFVDPGQVESALLNLTLNARDAMRDGGKLTIRCENVSSEDTSPRHNFEIARGDYVVLEVADTGIGMSADIKSMAFEPFFTTKDVGEGSGLGLSMVYGFAKQSGGGVTIDSTVGKGTTVRLYLPRAPDVASRGEKDEGTDEPLGSGETVLVIEDDPDVRAFVVTVLETLNYRPIEAQDVAAAKKRLEEEPKIDMVLSDVVLPGGVSGPEFAEEMSTADPTLKFAFMSGYSGETLRTRKAPLKGQILLTKPFKKHELARALRDTLRE